jgi:hypothetical protein
VKGYDPLVDYSNDLMSEFEILSSPKPLSDVASLMFEGSSHELGRDSKLPM